MKLAYIANIRFPSERAHGAQIAHMCEAFAENAVSVDLLVSDRTGNNQQLFEEYYGFSPSFIIRRYYTPNIVGWGFVFFLFASFILSLGAWRRVVFGDYDIIYSRDQWILLFFSFFLPTRKLVWESHEGNYSLISRALLHRGVKVVAISEGIRDLYVSKGISSERILVAHDGIDDTFFGEVESKDEARARLALPQDKKIAMYIGGFDVWKGVETFFKASEIDDTRILFVAIGGTSEEIASFQSRYSKVRFLGTRPYRELKDNQQAADVLVIPNTAENDLSAKFTSPLKLFAHLTAMQPLLCSAIPSLTNVVSEEQVWFFRPDDSEDLARMIGSVLTDPRVDQKYKRAFELSRRYSWSQRARTILSFVTT